MSVLVTGATGFMGSWLAKRLADAGEEVLVPDRPPRPGSLFERERLGERVTAVPLDLLDGAAIARLLDERGVDSVFHLAAQTVVGEANRHPAATFELNVRGTWTLLEAARARGDAAPRVVLASSYHAYGRHPEPMRESTALQPSWPYDTSKAAGDLIAHSYGATYGLPVAILRLANVYGGGDTEYSRLVPDAARALVEGRRPVIRSDGTPERDFVYVEDAVDAYLAVRESLAEPSNSGRAWNAGSGETVSILELIRRLVAASGRTDLEPDVQGAPQPRDDVDRQLLDSSLIAAELGWTPRHDLDAGLAKTWRWYSENLPSG